MARHRRRQRLQRPLRSAHRRNPPYRVYELIPTVAYAFGTANNLGERSTRFRFSA
jgi:hypothetical protein